MLGIEPQSKLNCEVRTTMTNMIMILMMKMRTETTNDRCWTIKLALRFVGRLRGRALWLRWSADLVIFFIVVGALIGGVVVVDRRLQDEHSDPGDWWIWWSWRCSWCCWQGCCCCYAGTSTVTQVIGGFGDLVVVIGLVVLFVVIVVDLAVQLWGRASWPRWLVTYWSILFYVDPYLSRGWNL